MNFKWSQTFSSRNCSELNEGVREGLRSELNSFAEQYLYDALHELRVNIHRDVQNLMLNTTKDFHYESEKSLNVESERNSSSASPRLNTMERVASCPSPRHKAKGGSSARHAFGKRSASAVSLNGNSARPKLEKRNASGLNLGGIWSKHPMERRSGTAMSLNRIQAQATAQKEPHNKYDSTHSSGSPQPFGDEESGNSWQDLLKRRHLGFTTSRSNTSLDLALIDQHTSEPENAEDWIDIDSWVGGSGYSPILFVEEQQPLNMDMPSTTRDAACIPSSSLTPSQRGIGWGLKKVVHSARFEQCIGLLVLSNAILLGIEANSRKDMAILHVTSLVDTAFCVIFVAEWLLRIIVYRSSFFTGDDCLWNVFDTVIVGMQALESLSVLVNWFHMNANASVLRMFRIVRLLRVARLLRVLRLFQDLRTITSSITQSTGALGWTLFLLGVMIYSFAIIVTELVNSSGSDNDDLFYWFGSLVRTMLTLFECLLGGVSWDVVVVILLEDVSLVAGLMLCLYMAVGLFIMLNVVTGLFVEKAMHTAREEGDMAMATRLGEMYKRLAEEAQAEQIDWKLFEAGMETIEMKEYLKAVNIDVSEARSLFDLIDLNRDGSLDVDEIVQGCLRLRGDAKALDLILLMHHMINMHEESLDKEEEAKEMLDYIADHLGATDPGDKPQPKAPEYPAPRKSVGYHMRNPTVASRAALNEEPSSPID